MTPLERLMAEELPTGTWGGPRLEPEPGSAEPRPVSGPDPLAAQHCDDLLTALDEHAARRRLRVVTDTAA